MKTNAIFNIDTPEAFEAQAIQTFTYQYKNNKVYRHFCDLLHRTPQTVKHLKEIPFLPIQFFKSHEVICGNHTPEIVFTSSGTTGSITSKHGVSIYKYIERVIEMVLLIIRATYKIMSY